MSCQNWDKYSKCKYAFCDMQTCKICKEYQMKNQFSQTGNMVKKSEVSKDDSN